MPIQYSSNGIKTQSLSEILDEREQALQNIMGANFIIDKNDPIGNMELADANSELAIQELLAWLIPNQLDANTATGIFLEVICEKNRIYRKQPKQTTLNFVIHGIKNTEFNSGDITVSDSLTGIYYNLDQDCIIDENGTTSARFICEEYGENYPIDESELNILTPVYGLNKITLDKDNTNLVLGRLTETDDELRRRRFMSVQQNSTALSGALKSMIYSLDGVKYVKYFENYTETTDLNGLPMKSFEYVVYGGDEDEIIDLIFTNKTIGTRAFGTTTKLRHDEDGNTFEIGFTKAEEVNLGMKIELETSSIQSESWKNNIKEAIIKEFNKSQGINDSVKAYNYYKIITPFSGITDIKSLNFYKKDDDNKTLHSQIEIGLKEIAKLQISDIEIKAEVK